MNLFWRYVNKERAYLVSPPTSNCDGLPIGRDLQFGIGQNHDVDLSAVDVVAVVAD